MHPLAAGVFDGEFTCPEMVIKQQRMRGSNINPPCAQRIGRDWRNDMLTSPTWVSVSDIEGVDTIEYQQSDGIVRTLVLCHQIPMPTSAVLWGSQGPGSLSYPMGPSKC